MIDPFTIAQTHPSLETRPPVQTHTMLEKTEYTDQQALLVQFRSSAAADLASLFKALGGGFHGADHPER